MNDLRDLVNLVHAGAIDRKDFLRRTAALGVSTMMAEGLLCVAPGAARAAERSQRGGTLTIIADSDTLGRCERITAQFKKLTGADVTFVSQSYNATHDKILTTAKGGSTLDITELDTIWPAEFAQAGIIMPVDKYVSPTVRDSMYKPLVDQLSFRNHLWGMPTDNEAKWLYYNAKTLRAAGFSHPPKTWDELLSMGQTIVRKGLAKRTIDWGWAQAEGLTCDWTLFLYGFGGRYRDSKGRWVFNDAHGQRALAWMVQTLHNGTAGTSSTTLNDRTVLNSFMVGDIPFVLSWSFAWPLTNDPSQSKIANNVGITIIPGVKEAGTISTSCTGGGGMAIAKESKQPDLAWQWINLYTSRANQVNAFKSAGQMPVSKSLYSDPMVVKQFPRFKAMGQQYPYAHFRPVLPWYGEWSLNLQSELSAALSGAKTPKQALNDAVAWSNQKSQQYGS